MNRYEDIHLAGFGDYMWDEWLEPTDIGLVPNQAAMDYKSPFTTIEKPGGAGNQVMNVLSLGGRCTAYGIWGGEESPPYYGQKMIDTILDAGGKNRFSTDLCFTTHFKQYYEYKGALLHRISNHDGVYSEDMMLRMAEYFGSNVSKYNGLLIADYNKGSMLPSVIESLIDICNKADVPVFVDPKFDNWESYAGATIFKPNEKEFGDKSIWDYCAPAGEPNIYKNIVLTKGAKGLYVFDSKKDITHIPAISGEVYDINGAGDCVMAAMALEYIKTDGDILKAAHVGNMAGGICVGHKYTYCVTEEDLRKAGAWDE